MALVEKKKETQIPKNTLIAEIDKSLSTSMTVKDIKILMEKLGMDKNYSWRENKLGNLTAWKV
jgi:hypothetical protein|tara:strand:- start:135 stop:323 length:189 start_codon:yes stop_codon:yes gene_type:complete